MEICFLFATMYAETCTVKKVIVFPGPSRDVTNQTPPGQELLNYYQQGRVLLMTSRLGTEKNYNLFYSTIMTRHLIVDSKTEAIYHMRSKFGMETVLHFFQ
jgi:hypothetical protein